MFWANPRPVVGKGDMEVGKWFFALPGGGEMHLVQAKAVADGVAFLANRGRLFVVRFAGEFWI